MFIFLRLYLAHLIGDFPLQFNKIYKLKHSGLKGTTPHVLIIMICMLAISWPYLNLPLLWIFIFFVGITHLFQDWLKVTFVNNYIKAHDNFWFYVLDQIIHFVILSLIFLTSLKNVEPPASQSFFFTYIYNNDRLILYFIALILATYNGRYMTLTFHKTFLKKQYVCIPFETWYCIFERALIVTLFFFRGFLFLLVPVVLLARPLLVKWGVKKETISPQFLSCADRMVSTAIAVAVGILLYVLLPYFS